jgi:hypothetical protein
MAQAGNPLGNRRLLARWACQLQARYLFKEHWHPATAMDVSRLGCRLRLGEPLARGARVKVSFECAAKAGAEPIRVEADGSVVWSRLEGLSFQCGIHFSTEVDAVEQFYEAAS